jgi:hypothetical protein
LRGVLFHPHRYALVAYNWRLRQSFFTMILAVMMIPTQVISIGFYQFMYRIGMTNNLLALILPSIAAPMRCSSCGSTCCLAEPGHRGFRAHRRRGRIQNLQPHRAAHS